MMISLKWALTCLDEKHKEFAGERALARYFLGKHLQNTFLAKIR
jgi:hypothetical protein